MEFTQNYAYYRPFEPPQFCDYFPLIGTCGVVAEGVCTMRQDFARTFDFSAIDKTFDIHDTGARWLLPSLLTA